MQQVKPKKALGQHFLTDLSVAARIASVIDDCKGMPVLEVGPGMGVLTRFLLDAGHDLDVVEIDAESVEYLGRNFPELDGHILERDFLKMNISEMYPDKDFCVIGNYPYNISSQIFFKVLEHKEQVKCCAGMLQKEVAERLAAPPGTKARGILSVLLQAWYDIEYLFTVNENVFNPPPKVKSGVIRMNRNGVTSLGCDERLFKIVVKTSFGQRRKTLRNSLRALGGGNALPDMPIFSRRPEQLSVEEFIELTNIIDRIRN